MSEKKIRTLNPGDLVKINEDGEPVPYIFLEYNHYGRTESSLIRKRIYCSGGAAGKPSSYYHLCYRDYFLTNEFLHKFDIGLVESMIKVPIKAFNYVWSSNDAPEQRYLDAYLLTYERSIFNISLSELGPIWYYIERNKLEGNTFTYFQTNENRYATSDMYPTSRGYYYLRSTKRGDSGGDAYGYTDGTNSTCNYEHMIYAGYGTLGFRPIITLNSDIIISNTVDSDGCYTIEDTLTTGKMYQKVDGIWRHMV